jgi:hypothetical protein
MVAARASRRHRDYLKFMGEGSRRSLCIKIYAPAGGLASSRARVRTRLDALPADAFIETKAPSTTAKTCTVARFDLHEPPVAANRLVDQRSISSETDGALGHLVGRWVGTGGRARCRLMTNQGLKLGKDEAAGLGDACASGKAATNQKWAKRIAGELAITPDRAAQFLHQAPAASLIPRRQGRTWSRSRSSPRLALS